VRCRYDNHAAEVIEIDVGGSDVEKAVTYYRRQDNGQIKG
jgi:hypothetical protein